MKRTALFALMMTLLLTGCAPERDKNEFLRWQKELAEGAGARFSAAVAADCGGETVLYAGEVVCSGGETSVTLTAPETVAGISWRSADGGETLSFENVTLELAPGKTAEVSPCRAGPLFFAALREGQYLYGGRDGETRTAALALGEFTVTAVFDAEMSPLRGEVRRDEKTLLTVEIDHWESW